MAVAMGVGSFTVSKPPVARTLFLARRAGWSNPLRAPAKALADGPVGTTGTPGNAGTSTVESCPRALPADPVPLPGTGRARSRLRRRSSCRWYPGSRRRPRACSGAAARPASRASRSRISRKRLSMCTGDSFFDQLLMPPPRPLLRAGRHEHLEPGVREDHGAHVAAVGHQTRAAGGTRAAARAAPRARRGGRRPATPPR